jgi:hypothetical protein
MSRLPLRGHSLQALEVGKHATNCRDLVGQHGTWLRLSYHKFRIVWHNFWEQQSPRL